jgi:hypothetical protein
VVIVIYMETTSKPQQIRKGYYIYRGVLIRKSERLGFVAIGRPLNGPWFNVGMGTLKNCVNDIDNFINDGWTIVKRDLVQVAE